MARLIDADALIENDLDFDTVDDCALFYDAIDNAPTVDAVEVVRCKDCKYSSVETKWNGKEYCVCNWKGADVHEVDERHYCSNGERREENAGD